MVARVIFQTQEPMLETAAHLQALPERPEGDSVFERGTVIVPLTDQRRWIPTGEGHHSIRSFNRKHRFHG